MNQHIKPTLLSLILNLNKRPALVAWALTILSLATLANVTLSPPLRHSHSSPDSASAPQDTSQSRLLKLGEPVESELAGGEAHYYALTLISGQYLRLVVDQRGVDVVV